MKDLTFETLIAVFEEIFGPALFWAMVAAAILVTLAFVFVVLRDRAVESRRLLRAELLAPIGAIAAIVFVQQMTNSGLKDLGGPVDLIMLIAIGVGGAGGIVILGYTAMALLFPPSISAKDRP